MKNLNALCFLFLFLGSCGISSAPQSHQAPPLRLLEQHQLDAKNFELFLRAFKKDQVLELWAKNKSAARFIKIRTYDFCTTSGNLGPKRKEGDLQIPEGCYSIDRFNPNSAFHLSLGINYPNASDRILGHPQQPGSDIFIHGGCASLGCIPITNSKIEELYALTSMAKELGQSNIQVHIFPSKEMEELASKATPSSIFWKNLVPIFNYFETHQQLPNLKIQSNGQYSIVNE